MSKTITYDSTIGLRIYHPNLDKSVLAKVWFAIQDNDDVIVTVENARKGTYLKRLGNQIISKDDYLNIDRDPYNDLIFAEAAFSMFGAEICGR